MPGLMPGVMPGEKRQPTIKTIKNKENNKYENYTKPEKKVRDKVAISNPRVKN